MGNIRTGLRSGRKLCFERKKTQSPQVCGFGTNYSSRPMFRKIGWQEITAQKVTARSLV